MDNLLETEKLLKTGQLSANPEMCVECKAKLSGEYSFFSGIVEDILTRKPKVWNAMRSNHKSDKACDKEYEATDDGINEVVLKMKLKRITVLISALNSLLRLAEGQANNQF